MGQTGRSLGNTKQTGIVKVLKSEWFKALVKSREEKTRILILLSLQGYDTIREEIGENLC